MMLWHAERADAEDEEKESLSDKFSDFLTALYAQQQNSVAEKCGVSSGEAWRTALEAASNVGAKQVAPGPKLILLSPWKRERWAPNV